MSMFSYSSEILEKRVRAATRRLRERAALLPLEPKQDSAANGPSRRPDFQESLTVHGSGLKIKKITSVDHGLRTHRQTKRREVLRYLHAQRGIVDGEPSGKRSIANTVACGEKRNTVCT